MAVLRSAVSLTALVALFLAAPAPAPAATSCDYSAAGKLLTIDMAAPGDGARIRRSGDEIVVSDGLLPPIACTGGTPTVTNTDAISAFNSPGGQRNLFRIAGPKLFTPGATAEDGDDEIEIFVNLNDAPDSGVSLEGDDFVGETVRLGKNGINPNAFDDENVPDADIVLNGVRSVSAHGGPGLDTFGAQGGAGTGGALTDGIALFGGAGADTLTGGEGDDRLDGGNGTNTLLGMGGNDELRPGPNTDTIDGGAGTDVAAFRDSPGGVSVDLAIRGPQSTRAGTDTLTNVEDLSGTEAPDVLRGDDGPNTLSPGEGNDVLEGRGGADRLFADEGADSLDVRDGGPDVADCGGGTDSVIADAPGIDVLAGCETEIFPPPPSSAGAAGASQSGGRPPAPAAFGARTRVTLALAARRIPAKGPVRVRVSNTNGFRVTGRLSGRARRVGLATKAFAVAAHGKTTVKLNLPRALRRLLKRSRGLSLSLTARVRDPAGHTRTVKRTVRPAIRAPGRTTR